MKGLGNDNQIAYIQVNKQRVSSEITYKEQKRNFFGKIIREEGFYYLDCSYFNNLIEEVITIPSHIIISGKIVFEKSHVVIEYINGRDKKIYFNSEQEMIVYIKREFQGREWRIYE